MSQLSERRRQGAGPPEIVGEHRVTRGVVAADHDSAAAAGLEPQDLLGHCSAELAVLPAATGQDQRPHTLGAEVAYVGELALRVTIRVAKHDQPVASVCSTKQPVRYLRKIGVADVVDDDTDGGVARLGQGPRVGIGRVGELARGSEHSLLQAGVDSADLRQRP